MSGSTISTPKMMIMNTPPVLCTHFPTDSPIVAATAISVSTTADASATNQLLEVIQAALGPMAYDRYVAHWSPISDV